MFTRRFLMVLGVGVIWLSCPGLFLFAAPSAGPESLSRINQIFDPVKSETVQVLPVHLSGTVCGVDNLHHGLVLHDNTGWLWLESETWPPGLAAGASVQIDGPVVFGHGHAILGGALLLQQKASQGPSVPQVRLHLRAGPHPFRLEVYSTTKRKEPVSLKCTSPGLSAIPMLESMLCHADPSAPGQYLPGMEYQVYTYDPAGRWDAFPDYDRLTAVQSGVTNCFTTPNVASTNCVDYAYRGFIAIPKDDDYEFEFTRCAADGSRFSISPEEPARIQINGTNNPPAPENIVPGQDWANLSEPGWVQTEGTVRQAGSFNGQLALELATANGRLPVTISEGDDRAAKMLLESEVQIVGLGWSADTHQGGKVAGRLLVPSMAEVTILQAPAERWLAHPVVPLRDVITNRPTASAPDSLVHVRGRVVGVEPQKSLVVRDETGEIEVTTRRAQAADLGQSVELLGQPDREERNRLRFVDVRHGPDFTEPARPLPLLTSTEQIRRLTMAEAARHYPVRFKGIVTFVFYRGIYAHIQGQTEGITIAIKTNNAVLLHPGDFYEFEGVTDTGLMSPTVQCEHFTALGRGQWPEPMRPTWRQLSNGSLDAQWVEVQGVVLSVKSLNLVLGLYGGEITARIYDADPAELNHLQNAVVRVRGSVTLANSKKRRIENISIEVNSRFDITVDVPAPTNVFAIPPVPISSLYSFDPLTTAIRPVTIQAQVLHSIRSAFYVTDGQHGLRVLPRQRVDVQPGDWVQVFGIPDNDGVLTTLRQASILKTGHHPLPEPQVLPPDQSVNGLDDSTLVQLDGVVLNAVNGTTNRVIQLQAGADTLAAKLDSGDAQLPNIPPASRVRVTGVYVAQTVISDSKTPVISHQILLNSPADLVVLARPSWWTWKHSLWFLGSMSLALAGAFTWITVLRRQVAQRTAELRAEMEVRRRAQLEVEQTHNQLVDASRRAGQAEVAANVLHNVGNVLNSVNVSTDCLAGRVHAMNIDTVAHTADLLSRHEADLPQFVTTEKGRLLPVLLTQLGRQLKQEQDDLLREIKEVRENIDLIKGIISAQQGYAQRLGVIENVVVADLIKNALNLQANAWAQSSVEIVRDYQPVPPVLMDMPTVLHILVNILQNARQACEAAPSAHKKIIIRIRPEGENGVRIAVQDNGVGIAPENLSRIFSHGFTTRKNGHGFGLHSAALAAKEGGGQLTVQSDGVGRGTTFTLTLPLRPPPNN
jgi:signal transduction histidine kinase